MALDTQVKSTDYFRGSDGNIIIKEASTNEAVPAVAIVDEDKNHLGGANFPMAVKSGDSTSVDAFGRQRTSGTGQRLDVEFTYDKHSEFFDETTSNGTVTHNGNERDLTLSLSDAVNGSHATMRSHPAIYTPGNSQLVVLSGVLDLADIGGGNAETFLRTKISGSIVETVIDQSDWLAQSSGVDWSQSHIFNIDFQSLKVGRIRFGMNVSGVESCVSQVVNDNIRDSGFWQLPSLPAYWRLFNRSDSGTVYTYMEVGYGNEDNAVGFRYKITANASATMKAICCTVKSEGGLDLQNLGGLPFSANNGVTVVTAGVTLVPILSIRPKTTFLTFDNLILALLKSFNLQNNNPVRLEIIHNGTLTNESWSDVDANSSVEFDVAATAISGGHTIFTEYITTSAKNRANSAQGLLGKEVLWNRTSSVTGIVSICAIRTTGTNADCLSALNWEELK